MRKAFRHSGVLMMVAVVALGLLGAAYTLWFEDLQLNATVKTGTFDADVSIHPWDGKDFGDSQTAVATYDDSGKPVVIVCSKPIPDSTDAADAIYNSIANGNPYGCTFGAFPENKPPTTCDASIGTFGSAPANSNDVTDENQLNLMLSGLYPFAGCTYRIDIHNSGSVPLHLNSVPPPVYVLCDGDATSPEDTSCKPLAISDDAISVISKCEAPVGPNATPVSLGSIDLATGQVLNSNGKPVQLHTGEELVCDVTILLDQGDNLEDKTIFASLNFRAYQWNESIDTIPQAP